MADVSVSVFFAAIQAEQLPPHPPHEHPHEDLPFFLRLRLNTIVKTTSPMARMAAIIETTVSGIILSLFRALAAATNDVTSNEEDNCRRDKREKNDSDYGEVE